MIRPLLKRSAMMWYGVPMFGFVVTLLLLLPLILPAPHGVTLAAEESLLTRMATVEARQVMTTEQLAALNAKLDARLDKMETKFDTLTNALIGGMLAAILTMGAALWQMRKK